MTDEDHGRVRHLLGGVAADQHDVVLVEREGSIAARPRHLVRPGPALDQSDRLEPASALAGGLQPTRAQLLNDISGGAALARGAGSAALEGVAGEDLDMAPQVACRDRWAGLGRGGRSEEQEERRSAADEPTKHGAA